MLLKKTWQQFCNLCENNKSAGIEVLLEIYVWVIREFSNSKSKDTKGEVIDRYSY